MREILRPQLRPLPELADARRTAARHAFAEERRRFGSAAWLPGSALASGLPFGNGSCFERLAELEWHLSR